jgi:hypothetical protein
MSYALHSSPQNRDKAKLLEVFMLCAPVLLFGAIIQFFSKDTKAGICTLMFALAPALVLAAVLFLWVIAHLL